MKTSGVLAWSSESLKDVPASVGVLVLRTSPINGFVCLVDKAENLKQALEDLYNNQVYPDVNFFEWYEMEPADDVDAHLAELKAKYDLEGHDS